MVCAPKYRLQMSVFTNADGFGFVPARLAISPHDTSERCVSLQCVATIAVVSDDGAQLEVCAHPGPITHQTRFEARLPWVFYGERENSGKSLTDGSV